MAWRGDALRIRQILSNLISNALKFTQIGSVTLAIRPSASGVRFQVIDSGIGLSDMQIPTLFEKFSQGDTSTTRRYGGTGLGLSICRQLVELMGGSISVSSTLGEGSIFTVDLPLIPADDAQVESKPGDRGHAAANRVLQILAAEDNLTNQLVLRAMIGPLNAELTLAANGREAVEAVSRQAFDIVLMDVQMPEMNGLEATQEIRAIEAARGLPRMPILALTANVMSHQLDAYLVAGMDGHVGKPIDAETLYAALESALALSDKSAEAPGTTRTSASG